MSKFERTKFIFTPVYGAIGEVLADDNLASLGDAYTNLVYSLYLSLRNGTPCGAKAASRVLCEAFRRAGLRALLPHRMDRHKQADAAEALLAYVWLHGLITLRESVEILHKNKDIVLGFASLLNRAKEKFDTQTALQ